MTELKADLWPRLLIKVAFMAIAVSALGSVLDFDTAKLLGKHMRTVEYCKPNA